MAELFVGVVSLANVRQHPNADALDLANIEEHDGFQVVLPRDSYQEDDLAVYIPEGAVVPKSITDEIGVTGKLGGKNKDVVKAVRLRGEISQGLVWVPGDWDLLDLDGYYSTGENLAGHLGITKFVPEVPVHMAGEQESAPDLMPWIEVENLKKFGKVFTEGELVVVQEKIHGTCCLITYVVDEDRLYVSSKGVGKEGLAIKESDSNIYWRAVKAHGIHEKLKDMADHLLNVEKIALFAEVFGEGVQDLHYGVKARGEKPGFAVFDLVTVYKGITPHWDSHPWFELETYGIPYVPVVYEGPFNRELINQLVDGLELVSGHGHHIREGIVVKAINQRYEKDLHGPATLKLVSEDYLTRKNGTEYQ